VDYNNLWDNSGDYVGVSPGPHDIAADPRFVDAAAGDFHLLPDSPCIDAGDPYDYPLTDFEGDPRPMGAAPDIGADEFRGFGVSKRGPLAVAPGETITYTLALVNLAPSAASSAVLTDTLPPELRYLGHQADGLDCAHDGTPWGGQLTCTPTGGALAVGESRPLTLTVMATETLPAPRTVVNTVSACASVDGALAQAQARARTDVTWCRVRLNDGPVGNDVQAAINASADPADVIKVSGACTGTLTLDKTLTLQGGWRDDFGLRDHRAYTTTLDARWRSRVLTINGTVAPTIDGFAIIRGRSAIGGGIYIGSSSPIIQDNTFAGNLTTGQDNSGRGGGISNYSGSPTIQRNIFNTNSASTYGGGIFNNSGSPIIQNNNFSSNSASYGGGGISNFYGSPTIQNNTFNGNSASSGGGIDNGSGNPTIQNNTFNGNSASSGGGIDNGSGNPTIQNNTLYANLATGYSNRGGGIYNSGSPTIRSNIIAGNTGSGIYSSGVVPGPSVDYNNLWNNSGGDYVGVSPGPHDIAADPRFVDAAVGDFHLRSDSPCIDAGDPYHRPETDFEGDPRPMGMEVDIGADEMRGLGVTKTGPNATTPGETIAYRLAVVNLAPSAVSSVVLTDTLPLAMHYVNHQAAGLDCAHDGSPWGGYLTCTLTHSSLAVGESRPLTVTVEVNNVLPTPLSAINTVRVKAILSGEHTHTQARVKTDVTWCRVRLNDGPVGNDVQAAINASADPADVIKVSGACAGTLTLDKTLTLQGGWRDDFGLRDHRAYTTTLDARWRSRVLRINGAVAPTIDGFTILHGYLAGSGSGIYSDSGNPTIQNNTFSGNSATGYYGYGGGIYNGSGSPTIQNNTFADNSASSYGGGIYNYSGNPIIQNNAFAGNSASSYGGGIYNYSGNPIIQNNAFAGNSASSYGGGIYNYSGTPIIQNNNFSSNSAFQGGGIYNGAGNPIIQNNNLSSNSASYDGGGIYNYSGNPTIRNNAIAGNSAAAGGGIYIAWAGPSLSVDYNNLWDNSGGNYP